MTQGNVNACVPLQYVHNEALYRMLGPMVVPFAAVVRSTVMSPCVCEVLGMCS